MSEGPIITGKLRLKDETGPTIQAAGDSISQGLGGAAAVAGGIISAEFSRNVVGALEDVGRTSVEQAAAFELATARIIAASGMTGEEAEELREELEKVSKELGVEFGTGATNAMEALEALVKAGLDPSEEAAEALTGVLQLASIEGINTASAANMVVAAMTQFGLSATEATDVVDGFVKASAAGIDTASGYAAGLSNVGATASGMGLDMKETMAALVQLDNTFGGAQQSGTYLNRMLLDMTAKADDAGLSIYNMDGSMKSLDEIMGQVRTILQGFGDDQEAVNEWMAQFDSRAQKAILGLSSYDETIGETQAGLETMAGAQDQVNVILDTYAGKMSKTKAQQELNNIEIGATTTQLSLMSAEFMTSLGPIGNVMDAIGPSMLTGVMQGLTQQAIGPLIGKLVGGGGLSAALSGVGSIIPGIGTLIGAAGPIGLAVVALGAAVGIFSIAWKDNWFGIRDHVANMGKAIGDAMDGIRNWIDKNGILDIALIGLTGGLGVFAVGWKENWFGIRDHAVDAADAIQGVIAGMGESLTNAWEEVTAWADDVVNAAKDAWKKATEWLTKPAKKKEKKEDEEELPGPAPEPAPWDEHYEAQHGFEGFVRRPTTFLAGEAGPEYVSITPRGRRRGGLTINGPLLVIQGSADEATANRAIEILMGKLRKY